MAAIARTLPQPQAVTITYTAAYIRLTRDESLQNGLSAPAQRDGIARYFQQAKLAAPLRIFEETKAVGGDTDFEKRAAGKQLIAAIRADEVKHIIVRDIDRLTRDLSLGLWLMELCREHSVTIHTFSGPIAVKSASDRFAYHVRSAAAQFEKDQVGDRVSKAKQEAVRQGRWPGGPPPYGYMTQAYRRRVLMRGGLETETANTKACTEYPIRAKLYLYEPEAEAVRVIYELAAMGWGTRRTVNELNRRGFRTRMGAYWSSERLTRTVSNPAAAGYLTYDDQTDDNSTPLHKREMFKGQHQAIITLEQWREIQRTRLANRQPGRRNGALTRANRQYLLSGIILCQCGSPMRGRSIRANRSGRYICCRATYHGRHTERGCPMKRSTINAKRIHEVFWPHLRSILAGPDLIDRVFAETQKLLAEAKRHKGQAIVLSELLAKAEKQLTVWYRRHDETTDDAAQEAAWRRVVELTAEKKRVQKAIAEQSKLGADPTRITRQQVADYMGSMAKLVVDQTPDEAKAFIRSLADHHGLRVQMSGPETMKIELTIRSPGTVGGGVPVSAEIGVPMDKVAAWMDQECGTSPCELCGEPIPLLRRHFWVGKPRRHRSCHSRELARLRNHRDDGMLSGADLARKFGVGESTIGRWEKSGRLPPPDLRERGCKLWKPEQITESSDMPKLIRAGTSRHFG
jgi:DNA invertase Pin-like site-specific DNA recombinase